MYAPTSARCRDNNFELDEFYDTLTRAIHDVDSSSLFFVVGDFNAKAGTKQQDESCIGSHGRGIRNVSGETLVQFCEINRLFLSNTAFCHSARHRTTWTGQRLDRASGKIVNIYNQIDYILCRQSQKRLFTNARSYNGTEVTSDHRIVVARTLLPRVFGIWGRAARSSQKKVDRLAVHRLPGNPQLQNQLTFAISDRIQRVSEDQPNTGWDAIAAEIFHAGKEIVGVTAKTSHRHHDPEIERLSCMQRDVRLRIQGSDDPIEREMLRTDRNQILHDIRNRSITNRENELISRAEEIERLKDGAQMFQAVHLLRRKPSQKVVVKDSQGKIICNDKQASLKIKNHFSSQLSDSAIQQFGSFTGEPRPLQHPVSTEEVKTALARLNNGRAAGPDNIPGELLKYSSDATAPVISRCINSLFQRHRVEPFIGHGTLIPLQKPGKPVGALTSLRPIILLTTLRKVMSLVVLKRISPAVNDFLSLNQSGFRAGRSTADVVWCHRWLAATTQRYHWSFSILGIDMSRAFDTIRRGQLMDVVQRFLEEDEVRLIRYLISDTNLAVRLGTETSSSFSTNIGTPQGDSLSPILFVIYLEAALQDVRQRMAAPVARHLPYDVEYADDVDFISISSDWLRMLEPQVATILGTWSLTVNQTKTEFTAIQREADRADEPWRMVKKLGSLLGDAEDVTRRKQLAAIAFKSLCQLWKRRDQVSLEVRVRLYNCFVLPVLLYNCSTWGITRQTIEALESYHRRQLRHILGIRWPNRLSNDLVYERCSAAPLGNILVNARWRLFGHILRSDEHTPAREAMSGFFGCSVPGYRGRPRITLPVLLNQDAERVGCRLRTPRDLQLMAQRALDRREWTYLCNAVTDAYKAEYW